MSQKIEQFLHDQTGQSNILRYKRLEDKIPFMVTIQQGDTGEEVPVSAGIPILSQPPSEPVPGQFFALQPGANPTFYFVAKDGSIRQTNITATTEVVFQTDENGNFLTDENGNFLID